MKRLLSRWKAKVWAFIMAMPSRKQLVHSAVAALTAVFMAFLTLTGLVGAAIFTPPGEETFSFVWGHALAMWAAAARPPHPEYSLTSGLIGLGVCIAFTALVFLTLDAPERNADEIDDEADPGTAGPAANGDAHVPIATSDVEISQP